MFVITKKKAKHFQNFVGHKKPNPRTLLQTRVIGTSPALGVAPRQNGGGFGSVHRFGLIVEGK